MTLSPSHSTPRAPTNATMTKPTSDTATFANYPSPYEALRQEVSATSSPITDNPAPATPGKSSLLRDKSAAIAKTPDASSPFLPPTSRLIYNPPPSTSRRDPLLHRVLDRNYRIQATPHTASRQPRKTTTRAEKTPSGKPKYLNSSPFSSPDVPPPELHAEIFSTPVRKGLTPAVKSRKVPKPGVSVLTPAKQKAAASSRISDSARKLGSEKGKASIWTSSDNGDTGNMQDARAAANDGWEDSDEDSDGDLAYGQSPPKTMTFHVPQRRLMRTPGE